MTPISLTPDAEPPLTADASDDFGSRVTARLRTLVRHARRRQSLLDAFRAANDGMEPGNIAAGLIERAQRWIPAPCWCVVARDHAAGLTVLAERGLSTDVASAMWCAARWVTHSGLELFTGDLASDGRTGATASGAALAFPLLSRGQTIGALVAVDPVPAASIPELSPALASAVRELLEPFAAALANTMALRNAESLSVTDDLTRVYNSRYLNQALRRETKRALRTGRPLSLLFLDLDGFKSVNDTHGHVAGSKALVEVAGVLRGCARETDVIARFGGDEFAVILPDTGASGARLVATRMLLRLRQFRYLEHENLGVRLTASIGAATLPDTAHSADELLRTADAAMYRVKASGKDGVHVARQDDTPAEALFRRKE